jgi:hypothetical protein
MPYTLKLYFHVTSQLKATAHKWTDVGTILETASQSNFAASISTLVFQEPSLFTSYKHSLLNLRDFSISIYHTYLQIQQWDSPVHTSSLNAFPLDFNPKSKLKR